MWPEMRVALLTLLLSLVGGALGLKFSRLNLDEVNEQDLANDTLLFESKGNCGNYNPCKNYAQCVASQYNSFIRCQCNQPFHGAFCEKFWLPGPYFNASSVQRILNLGPAGDEARLEFIEQELYKFLVTVYPEIYKPDAPFDRLNFTEELVDAVKWKEHKTTFECTQAAVPFMDEMERLPAPNTPHLRQRFLVLRYALRDFMNSCRWKYHVMSNLLNSFEDELLWGRVDEMMHKLDDFKEYETGNPSNWSSTQLILNTNNLQGQVSTMEYLVDVARSQKIRPYISTIDAIPSILDEKFGSHKSVLATLTREAKDTYLDNLVVDFRRYSMEPKDVYNTTQMVVLGKIANLKQFIYYLLPNTRPHPGVTPLPFGYQYYQACLTWHLAQPAPDPNHIYELGMYKVEEIEGKILQMMREDGYVRTKKDYVTRLNDYDLLMNKAPSDEGNVMRDLVNVIKPRMKEIFAESADIAFPRITTVDDFWKHTWYRNGAVQLNTVYVGSHRILPLTLGFILPGRHFLEKHVKRPDYLKIPLYRQNSVPIMFQTAYPAYYKGWEAYAQTLGLELGMYKTRLDLLAFYVEELQRGCLAVIDVGLHHMRWSRNEALFYLWKRLPFPNDVLATLVDRVITWPGQATAPLVGQHHFLMLRETTKIRKGDSFDLIQFHSKILQVLPGPLALLDTVLDGTLGEVKPGPVMVALQPDEPDSSTVTTSRPPLWIATTTFCLLRFLARP